MGQRNRLTAAVLAIFSGFVGGHKLYLGDSGGFTMFFFLLIFSINVFGMPLTLLLGIFDAFKLLSMNDDEFNKRYNRGIIKPKVSNVDRRRENQMRKYEEENVKRGYENRVPTRQTVRSNPFKKSGLDKYKEFDLEAAISDFKQGLEISPDDIALHFNLACAYSLTEKKEDSFYHLSKAVSLGFSDFERILNHDDLAYLRIQPEFEAFKQSGFTDYQNARSTQQNDVATQQETQQSQPNDVLLSQLNRLAELRNRGILSDAEFNIEKQKLLRQ